MTLYASVSSVTDKIIFQQEKKGISHFSSVDVCVSDL